MGKEIREINENNPRPPQPEDAPVLHAMLNNIGTLNIQDELKKDQKIHDVYKQLIDYYEAQADERESSGKRAPDPIDSRLSALESIANLLNAKTSGTPLQQNEQSKLEILAEEFGLWVWDKYPDEIISYLEHLTHKDKSVVAKAHKLAERLHRFVAINETLPAQANHLPLTVINREPAPFQEVNDVRRNEPKNPKKSGKESSKAQLQTGVVFENKTQQPPSNPNRPKNPTKRTDRLEEKPNLESPTIDQKIAEYVKLVGDKLPKNQRLNLAQALAAINSAEGPNASAALRMSRLNDVLEKRYIKGLGRGSGKTRDQTIPVFTREEIAFAFLYNDISNKSGMKPNEVNKLMKRIAKAFEKYDEVREEENQS